VPYETRSARYVVDGQTVLIRAWTPIPAMRLAYRDACTMSNSLHDPALPLSVDAHRFAFGENWKSYIQQLDEKRLRSAEASMCELLGVTSLAGKRFLDAGSGSGLFSLVAVRLGAAVHSFDFDATSVKCAEELRCRDKTPPERWRIQQGSVLDNRFLSTLGRFDVVYSWGVLHHTGDMWRALENVIGLVAPSGTLCIALYNDQGMASRVWRTVKRTYNRLPPRWRFLVLWPSALRLWGPTIARDALSGRPLKTWLSYGAERGMSPFIDVKDWVGGFPFEVASVEQVEDFCSSRGLTLTRVVRRAGIGCNEFVFNQAVAAAAKASR
jgi:SAM-dependent methyltransferase